MKKQNYAGVAASVYINFALVGMATIIISQYSSYFQKAWNTDVKGISTVLSVVGIGRILTILFAGVISDKIGRKKTMIREPSIAIFGWLADKTVVVSCLTSAFGSVFLLSSWGANGVHITSKISKNNATAKIIAVNLAFETEATQNGNKNWHNDIAALTNEFIVADFSGKASVRAG